MWQESTESFTLLNKTHKISVFGVHIWPNLTSPFYQIGVSLQFGFHAYMKRSDRSITHAADTVPASSSFSSGFLASKLDRWFISPGDWAIITWWPEVGDYYALASCLRFCPPSNVFHTSSCRVKKYFTPLGLAERGMHTKVDGVYLWLVTGDRWGPLRQTRAAALRRIVSWDLQMDIYLWLEIFNFLFKPLNKPKNQCVSWISCHCIMHFPENVGHTAWLERARSASHMWPFFSHNAELSVYNKNSGYY